MESWAILSFEIDIFHSTCFSTDAPRLLHRLRFHSVLLLRSLSQGIAVMAFNYLPIEGIIVVSKFWYL